MRVKIIKLSLLLFGLTSVLNAQPHKASLAKITVDVNKPVHAIPSTLFGIFFEDINHSTDGGIYPELVRNRSFEDADQPEGWRISNSTGETGIDSSKPLNPFNRHSLQVKLNGSATIENDGYWGMNISQGATYLFSVAARATEGFASPLVVRLVSGTDTELAKAEVTGFTSDWKYHRLELTANGSDPKARLQLSASGRGTLNLDMVSLLPKATWKSHGLRPDLAEMLDALKPSFMRIGRASCR